MLDDRVAHLENELSVVKVTLANIVANCATKKDLAELEGNIRADMAELRGGLHVDIEKLRGETTMGLETLRGETATGMQKLRGDIEASLEKLRGELRAEIHQFNASIKGWLLATVLTMIGTIVAAMFGVVNMTRNSAAPPPAVSTLPAPAASKIAPAVKPEAPEAPVPSR